LTPSVFGSTFPVVLIQYSKPLSYLGLSIVLGFTVVSALRLRKKLKERKEVATKSKGLNNRSEFENSYRVNQI